MDTHYTPHNLLSPGEIIIIANRMLYSVNKYIVEHNERTTFIALELAKHHKMKEPCTIRNLCVLSLFHTIGFFQKDAFTDSNIYEGKLDYFSGVNSTESKYVFGSYYLEYMTFLGKDSNCLETFNQDFIPERKNSFPQEEYKSIIYLAARISNFYAQNPEQKLPEDLNELAPGKLDPEYIKTFNEINKENTIINQLNDKSYVDKIKDFVQTITLNEKETYQLEKLLIYFLDFKSTFTVKHIINTSCYALALGQRLNFSEAQLDRVFVSAILHDIGKMATPQRILEFPGRLSPEDMGIMRYHVNHSKRILNNQAPDDIIENVFRHHEKLNGSGYPKKLSDTDLDILQKVLTVSDITSALCDSRSYKEGYSKEKVIAILSDMTEKGELEKKVTDLLFNEYDNIQSEIPELQKILSTNFSKVISKYNDYIFNMVNINSDDLIEELSEDFTESNDDLDDNSIEELEEL